MRAMRCSDEASGDAPGETDAGEVATSRSRADMVYEPKWDGFRCIVFRDGDEIELGSRNEKPLTRYFPEVVEAVRASLPQRCVLDGEIVIVSGKSLDFEALASTDPPCRITREEAGSRDPCDLHRFRPACAWRRLVHSSSRSRAAARCWRECLPRRHPRCC